MSQCCRGLAASSRCQPLPTAAYSGPGLPEVAVPGLFSHLPALTFQRHEPPYNALPGRRSCLCALYCQYDCLVPLQPHSSPACPSHAGCTIATCVLHHIAALGNTASSVLCQSAARASHWHLCISSSSSALHNTMSTCRPHRLAFSRCPASLQTDKKATVLLLPNVRANRHRRVPLSAVERDS